MVAEAGRAAFLPGGGGGARGPLDDAAGADAVVATIAGAKAGFPPGRACAAGRGLDTAFGLCCIAQMSIQTEPANMFHGTYI